MNVLSSKKNVLVIGAHFHCERIIRKEYDFLQPMIGLHIASQIDQSRYDITIHNELSAGPFDHGSGKFYDIVFLSGIQKDFDRMRQLSFFFRRQGSLTVAGGSICTLYPEFAQDFFDVVCSGGVDSVFRVMNDYESGSLKKIYHSPQHHVRDVRLDHSLLTKCRIRTSTHLIEASRGCNYACGFCTMPAEKARHTPYSIERVRDDIRDSMKNTEFLSLKRWYPILFFIDNHFTLNRQSSAEICRFIKSEKRIKWWGALLSQNDLSDGEFISFLASCKCESLFIGLESIDEIFLEANSKKQNLSNISKVMKSIDFAQKKGIIINFGYLFDPRISSIAEMKDQFRKITGNDMLLFPCFFSFVSPLLGTKVFFESMKKRELMPNLMLRDLDGCTLAYRNVKDGFGEITEFADIIFNNLSVLVSRWYMTRKTLRYIWRYKVRWLVKWYAVYKNNTRPFNIYKTTKDYKKRTYIGGTDILDPQYYSYPDDISDDDYARYFAPVMVTDENGEPAEWLKKYLPGQKEEDRNRESAAVLQAMS